MEDGWDQPDPWPGTIDDDDPGGWPPEDVPDHWVAHEQPERPLAYGMPVRLRGCSLSLRVAAIHEPRLPIVLKTGSDHVVVTAEYADQVWSAMGGLEPLCYVRRDYIREVFVGDWLWWMRSDRWWSLTRSERTKSKLGGLRHATRSPSAVGGFATVDNPRVPRNLVPAGAVPTLRNQTIR